MISALKRQDDFLYNSRQDPERMKAGTEVLPDSETHLDLDKIWNVVVWDDPVNLMSYVVYVFQKVFGYPRGLCEKLMREVHQAGKSLVASEDRERAELHVQQLHQYGLRATLQRSD